MARPLKNPPDIYTHKAVNSGLVCGKVGTIKASSEDWEAVDCPNCNGQAASELFQMLQELRA